MFQSGVTVHSGASTTSNILSGTIVESSGNQGNLKIETFFTLLFFFYG